MDNEKLDDMIKGSLKKGTDSCIDAKDELWEKIDSKINTSAQRNEISSYNRQKPKPSRKSPSFKAFRSFIAAAVLIIVFIAIGTTQGKAAMKSFLERFQPKKNITIEIEGQEENSKVDLKQSRLGYIIYIDEALYTFEGSTDKDVIKPKAKSTDSKLPEVFMEISHNGSSSQMQLFKALSSELKLQYKTVKIIEKNDYPVKSISITAYNGVKWSDKKLVFLLIDDGHGGVFQIRQQYFFEASEGHGVRFNNMLKEFKIIETP